MSNKVRHLVLAALAPLALLAGSGCGGGGGGGGGTGDTTPSVKSITPTAGFSGSATKVTIKGGNFLFSPTSSLIHAFLDDTELADKDGKPGSVTRVDVNTLEATVPAGLAVGKKTLRVTNGYGKQGTLANAFTVTSLAAGALTTTVAVTPTTASVGQTVSLVATVENVGSGAVTEIQPNEVVVSSADGAAASVTGPDPASVASLSPGGKATFTWQVVLQGAGHLDLAVSAAGNDVFSGLEVASPAATTPVLAQLPAGLVATISASRPTVDVNQQISLSLTVTNGGQAAANVTGVTPSGVGSCGPVTVSPTASPASPIVIPTGESRSFDWACKPSAAGTLTLGGTAVGTDANSGQPVSATVSTPAVVAVQAPASLSTTIAVDGNPTSASVGQALTVRVTVLDTGGGAVNVSPPTVTPSGSTAACGGVTPSSPQTVLGGGSQVFTATCTPATSGSLHLAASVSASTVNTGAILTAGASLASPISVQLPPGLVITVGATPSTVDVGPTGTVTATFTVGNGGGASADGVTVTPAVTGSAPVVCGTVAPGATNIAPGVGSQVFTMQCIASDAGSLVIGGTAAGTDHNSGLPVTATTVTTASVTVEKPAGLGAVITVDGSPSTVNVGQALTARLTVTDTGGAQAILSSVTPTPAGICMAASPAPPQTVTPGAPVTFTWTCTPASAGPLTLGASVAGSDKNNGAALTASASLSSPITVQLPSALTATVGASAATVNIQQAVTVTFTVTNGGGAAANGVAVTPSVTGAGGSCGTATPTTANIGASLSQVYSWSCSGSSAATLTLSGTAKGTDANSNQQVTATPATAATVAVQAPAALSAAITVDGNPTTASVGQALTARLVVTDTGGASATVSAVTPSPAGICAAVAPLLPQTVLPGAPATFTWTCTPSAPGPLTLSASVGGADKNTAAVLAASASLASAITVQTPPVLVATVGASPSTVDVGQTVTVTFNVTNGGGAQANGVAVTPSVTGGTCGVVSPAAANIAPNGGIQPYSFTCSAASAGTLTVSGTAAGTDANTNNPVSATPATAATVNVQTPAALGASLGATPTTVIVGQNTAVTLTVSNTGGASAQVTAVTPSSSNGAAGCPAAPSQTLPVTIAGNGSADFTWTCSGATAGVATLGATAAWHDLNNTSLTGTAAPTGVGVTVQTPPLLGAVLVPGLTQADAGQAVGVALTVTNTGGTAANVTAVTASMGGVTGGACTTPNPSSFTLPALTGSQQVTWSCSSAGTGTASLDATVTASNASSPSVTPAAVTIQAPAVLGSGLSATPTTVTVGQSTAVTLTVSNTGGASAQVTAVTPSSTAGAATCPSVPNEGLPVTISGSGSSAFHWTCNAASAGTATLGATGIAAHDVNNPSLTFNPVPTGVGVTVQTAAALTAGLVTSRSTADTGQAVGLTLTVSNSGQTAASVTNVTNAIAGVTGSCTAPSATSFTVPGVGSQQASWSCTPTGTGTASLAATVIASGTASPSVSPASVTVVSPASLSGTLSPATAPAGPVSVILSLTNLGGAGSTVSAASLTVTGTGLSCLVPPDNLPVSGLGLAGGGGTGSLTWSCVAFGSTATAQVVLTALDDNGVTPLVSIPTLDFAGT